MTPLHYCYIMKISFLLLATFRGRGCSSCQSKKIGGKKVLSCLFTSTERFFSQLQNYCYTVTFNIKKQYQKQSRQGLQRCNSNHQKRPLRYISVTSRYTTVTLVLHRLCYKLFIWYSINYIKIFKIVTVNGLKRQVAKNFPK